MFLVKKFNVKYTLSLKEQHKVSVKAKSALAGNIKNAKGKKRVHVASAAQGIEDDPLEKVESGGVIDASAYSELDVALRSSPAARAFSMVAGKGSKPTSLNFFARLTAIGRPMQPSP